MPSKYDAIRLDIADDRRYRTSEEDRRRICELYAEGWTMKEIAKKYGVAQSTVGYIVNPKSKETRDMYAKRHPRKGRDREEHRRYMKELRDRKRDIEKREVYREVIKRPGNQ